MEHEHNHEHQKGEHVGDGKPHCGPGFAHMHNKRMRVPLLIAIVLFSVYLLAVTITEVQGWKYVGSGIQPTNTISVQGEGEVFAVPDTGIFTFSVIKEGATVEVVQADATEIANKTVEYLKENGVEEKDIKTIGYNVYPKYEQERIVCITYPCPQGERKLVGFEISQSTQVKVRDTEKAGELLAGVGSFDIQNISGLSFTIDDENELNRQARKEALKDAKTKAEALADDLGVYLVRVVNFNEYESGYYGRFDSGVAQSGIGGEYVVAPKIELGENRITSNVNITYEIR
ncbi:SIMPL domain-containing protein [Candidatus Kaiserbacteria bacterium]|nr:SIMPL domain-containing protein [Candidatus Kaiserbacteria bacterium]